MWVNVTHLGEFTLPHYVPSQVYNEQERPGNDECQDTQSLRG